ncbi:hypothetical protein [Bordetella genomosp. 7]|uniref:hypothetical protein n=1 Tax=Bordetella genomosp. 7 TaxID=1416805 RepID=UPI001482C162|nr:hypothetical protein [Bordetella genomosp. 7]
MENNQEPKPRKRIRLAVRIGPSYSPNPGPDQDVVEELQVDVPDEPTQGGNARSPISLEPIRAKSSASRLGTDPDA